MHRIFPRRAIHRFSTSPKSHFSEMPKLYYTPTSCGAASFIAAVAAGIHVNVEQADIRTHKTSSGEDFYKINPKGNVPTLVLDDGTVLNEGSAVLQWIADQVRHNLFGSQHLLTCINCPIQAPGKIAADYGTSERYLTQVALNYIASEVHNNFGPLFGQLSAENKQAQIAKIDKKFQYISEHMLNDKEFLAGHRFSIADSYLYVVLSWGPYVGVDISKYPVIQAYFDRVKALPSVTRAHEMMATNPSST
jgi:glutathione S-transferase